MLTQAYACLRGAILCLFFRQLPFRHEGNEGNCGNDLKSARLHASRHIAGLISIYITNLKSYLGSKNNCLQLPANSQKPC